MPALLGQIVYMGWVSRARTLPLFMEATHALASFAVTATLLSSIVKPFGRPFKITDKGGDRSAPRVHWKLAATFGLIAAGSALSIVWAFVSPYAASEISSLDYFNLIWAGIAMLIAFTAFLVCFELPRGEEMFVTDDEAQLACDGKLSACRVAALSLSSVRLSFQTGQAPALAGSCAQLHLDWLGSIEVTLTSRDGETVLGQFQPDFDQRARLVVRLFSSDHGNVTSTASLPGAFAGLARRGFRGG